MLDQVAEDEAVEPVRAGGVEGLAVKAGGRVDGAATDYFLPLDRPSRALQCLQQSQPITRGTIQTQWMLKPFDDC